MSKSEKVKSNIPVAIITGIVMFGILMWFTSLIIEEPKHKAPTISNTVAQESATIKENSLDEEVLIEDIKDENMEEEKPTWYNQKYEVNHEDLDYMSSQTVNMWPSYDGRSTIVDSIPRYKGVALLGYREDYDYCQVQYNSNIGWIACGWLEDLPNEMVDYWDNLYE